MFVICTSILVQSIIDDMVYPPIMTTSLGKRQINTGIMTDIKSSIIKFVVS